MLVHALSLGKGSVPSGSAMTKIGAVTAVKDYFDHMSSESTLGAGGPFESWLEERSAAASPRELLPTQLELARTFGVSRGTIAKVLRRWAAEGRLRSVRGKGTLFVVDDEEPRPALSPRSDTPARVARHILASLDSGEIREGDTLPSLKSLSVQMHVGYRSVVEAYRRLAADGRIHRAGKSFLAGKFSANVGLGTRRPVYLIRSGSGDFSRVFTTEFLARAYLAMDAVLSRRSYFLKFAGTDDLPVLQRRWLRGDETPYGLVLVEMTEKHGERLLRPLGDFLRRHARKHHRLPVVIDWYYGKLHVTAPGMVLFSRGHILTTLCRTLAAFVRAGHARAATFYLNCASRLWEKWDVLFAFHRLLYEMRDLLTREGPHFVLECGDASPERVAILREKLLRGAEQFARTTSRATSQLLGRALENTRFVASAREDWERSRKTGLCVVQSSNLAAHVLDDLQGRGVHVPGSTTILALEDDLRFTHRGLSCCVPDWDTIGYNLAHHIIGDYPVARTTKGFIRSTAWLRHRETTA